MPDSIIDGNGLGFLAEVDSNRALKVGLVNVGSGTGLATSGLQSVQIAQIGSLTHDNTHTGNAELRIYAENHICLQNTTSGALLAGGSFVGTWQDCLNYQEVNVSVFSDKLSAPSGLVIQWSADGVNVGDDDSFTIYANAGTNYTPNPAFRYVRLIYNNGSVTQTNFSLMTILRRGSTGGSFHRIDSTLKDDSDARLNITVPKLKTAANTYVSQTATTAGNAKISLEELESGVSVNNKTQLKTTPFESTGSEIKFPMSGGYVTSNINGFRSSDNTYQPLRLDRSTNTIQTIDYAHHEIHAGTHFFLADYSTIGSGIGSSIFLGVTTPNTSKWAHLLGWINGMLITEITFYEGATISGGTAVTALNSNRNSSIASDLLLYSQPVISGASPTSGTTIYRSKFGLSTGGGATTVSMGGGVSRDDEIILRSGTSYLFQITSATPGNTIDYEFVWYEHTNIN